MKIPDPRYDALLGLLNERYKKIIDLLAEIEESAGEMPYPVRDATHYPGCWRVPGHHNCAVAMVERLAALWKGEEE